MVVDAWSYSPCVGQVASANGDDSRDFAMIIWIVSTLLFSLGAVLIFAPIIKRYALRQATAAIEARPQVDQSKWVADGSEPDLTKANERRSASVEPNPSISNKFWDAPDLSFMRAALMIAAVSAFSALAFAGIYTLIKEPAPSTDVSAGTALRGPATFSNDPSLTDQLLQQLGKFAQKDNLAQGVKPANSNLPPVDELIERLTARLGRNPKDIQGWRTLGWSYLSLKRFDEAAVAYARAIDFFPVVADLHSARGEALVAAANGTVTANAKQALSEALKLDAKEPRARYFLALAKAQTGDKAAALDDWIALANDVGANNSAVPALDQRLAELASELHVDVSKKLHRPLGTALGRIAVEPKSPTIGPMVDAKIQSNSQQTSVNAVVPPADQAVAIGDMVERLSKRLERSPRDVDGWIMLIRSKNELNDPMAARQVLERALKVFDEGSVERERLLTAAKSFGLSP